MRLLEIRKLVASTADAAFALSPDGFIAAWNKAASDLFGIDQKHALGKTCAEVLHGTDECGRDCNESCTIRQRARDHVPMSNYDLQIAARDRRMWCNVSVLIIDDPALENPYTVHIVRPSDIQKRFEILMRDFVVQETSLPAVNVNELMSAKRAPTAAVDLTKREQEVLRMLSRGMPTCEIAETLFISRTTANNHIQHIMKKLSAHTRLEAVRRAEQAGLI